MLKRRTVKLKSPREIEAMRKAVALASQTLTAVGDIIRAGMTTEDINTFVHDHTLSQGAVPAPLNYRGFPKSVCTSINEVVCHGIPEDRALLDGDIINVDVTHIYEGFHGDTSATFYVGSPSKEAILVTETSRRCLDLAIATVRPGARLGDIGAAIQDFAEAQQLGVVRDFVGHGIGQEFHEEPQVKHYGRAGRGERLKAGMIFTIEPMINLGTWEIEVLEDEWTAVTRDGQLSAQFEHTLLVTPDGVDVLTARERVLANSEIYPDYWKAGTAGSD